MSIDLKSTLVQSYQEIKQAFETKFNLWQKAYTNLTTAQPYFQGYSTQTTLKIEALIEKISQAKETLNIPNSLTYQKPTTLCTEEEYSSYLKDLTNYEDQLNKLKSLFQRTNTYSRIQKNPEQEEGNASIVPISKKKPQHTVEKEVLREILTDALRKPSEKSVYLLQKRPIFLKELEVPLETTSLSSSEIDEEMPKRLDAEIPKVGIQIDFSQIKRPLLLLEKIL